MTLLADKDERFKNLFGKAALFIALATIGVGLTLFWTGVKKGAFAAKSPIYFVADSGQDLSEGMPVKFSGFKIGKLSALALDEQGRVQIVVNIETKYLTLIRNDATITLKKEGVIGDGVLEISRGTEGKPALISGDKIHFERASGLEQAVLDMKARVLPVLDDLHQTLHDPNGDVRQTLKNLREFTAGIRVTQERLDRILAGVDNNMNNEAVPLLRSLKASAANAETISTRLEQALPVLLNNANGSMENIRITSELFKDTMKNTAPVVPEILGETRNTLGKTRDIIGDTQEIIDAVSARWPLKNIVPAADAVPVRMDSHD